VTSNRLICLTLVTLAVVTRTLMQIAYAQDRPMVEVASVKLHPLDENAQWMISRQPGGRLIMRMTPERLVSVAYRVQMDQVVNAPSWAKSDTYDILVKVREGAAVNIDTIGPIARELLEERFQATTHMGTRELPVYLLVAAREPGSTGPRLMPSQMDCTLRGGPPPPRTAADPAPAAATRCGLTQRAGQINMGGFPIDAFTRVLSSLAGRVVVNRTGLEGNWDLDLEFAPDAVTGSPAPSATDAPSLFTALQEQLGLKLESGRAPVPVVVVDNIARPTAD